MVIDVKGNILKEASSINKSLLFLGNLIDNLALKNSRKRIHQDRRISYRDCKVIYGFNTFPYRYKFNTVPTILTDYFFIIFVTAHFFIA